MAELLNAQSDLSFYSRRVASTIRSVGQVAILYGSKFECPLCGGHFRKWAKQPRAICPRCLSKERHRVLWLYLQQGELLFDGVRVLHFAPEPGLRRALQRIPHVEYFSGDLDPRLADVRVDITDIPFRDDLFDLVLCSHVLEHVPDDDAAMREMRRVLKPSGVAILQHPIYYDRTTYEDPRWTTPQDRVREFGQDDHVRIYGADFPQRLQGAGLTVHIAHYRESLSPAKQERYGLVVSEPDKPNYSADDLFICRKQ